MRRVIFMIFPILSLSLALTACPEENTCTGDNMQVCGSACVNTSNDGANCGGCNNVCGEGKTCVNSTCVGAGVCNGEHEEVCGNSCVNTQTNGDHCGGCNNPCASDQSCVDGECLSGNECTGTGMQVCSDVCVNTLTDAANCGGCNNVCEGGATCVEGACSCSGDLTYCVDQCVNTDTDKDNCGSCLHACAENQGCYLGGCATPFDESCDGKDNDFNGAIDEGADGHPLTRACDNLCGAGIETCNSGHYTGCTAPAPVAETCNGKDDDCDGLVDEGVMNTYYEDYDGDGFGDPNLAWATEACSLPTSPTINHGVYVADNTDCDDVDADSNPDGTEVCDGYADENCNGVVDENCGCSPLGGSRACGTDEGICVAGTQTCGNDGWSICAGEGYTPAEPTETCNGLDDDCDGQIDEELADDAFENNDTCEAARVLPDVNDAIYAEPVGDLNLYHGAASDTADHDWFKVNMAESDHTVECTLAGWPPMQNQCDFVATVGMTVPSDEVHGDYELCVYTGSCGDFANQFCTTAMDYDAATHRYNMQFTWDGTCGIDDSWELYVEVKNAGEMVQACETYSLDFDLSWGGSVQEDSCGG